MIVRGSVSSVAGGSEITVLTYTNTTGNVQYVRSLGLEGNAESSWRIFKNLSVIFRRKITNAVITEEVSLFDLKLDPGDILDVKVEHTESFLAEFSADAIITDTKENTTIIIEKKIFFELQLKGIIQNPTRLLGRLTKIHQLNGTIVNENILTGRLNSVGSLNGVLENEKQLIGAIKCD